MKPSLVYTIYKNNSYKTFLDMESAIKSNPEAIVIFEKKIENNSHFEISHFYNEMGEKIENFGSFKIHVVNNFQSYNNEYVITDTKGEVGFKYFNKGINGVVNFLVWVKEVSHLNGWSEYYLCEKIKNQNIEIEKLKNRIIELEKSN